MKRILVATLLCCALALIAVPALAESADAITIGTRRVIKSQVLKEERTVYIQLPESYRRARAITAIRSCTCAMAASSSSRSPAPSST